MAMVDDTEFENKRNFCEENNCKPEFCVKEIPEEHRGLNSKTSKRAKLNDDTASNLFGTLFNKILGDYTYLNPISTGAILDATSLEAMAECRANNYNATEYGTPTLECGEYNETSCEQNDYIIVVTNETDIDDYCLPDDFYCDDGNLCTTNPWDSDDLTFTSTPISCPKATSFDSAEG